MPRGLKVSRHVFASMVIYKYGLFLYVRFCYIRTFSVVHWDTQEDTFSFYYAMGRIH